MISSFKNSDNRPLTHSLTHTLNRIHRMQSLQAIPLSAQHKHKHTHPSNPPILHIHPFI
ncbi:hypothetical protein DL95DRAFT_75261 [Leptodontidium sp. 2 PMI_412]|nr:hypothetical protein DL95DRAFT_75261 [Leptodontidium sp. 2 PMI_412]